MADKTIRTLADAFEEGLRDALDQGKLTSGKTWPEQEMNEAYDSGANIGEMLKSAAKHNTARHKMRKITVIVPSMEGLFDADYLPRVFPGHLTKEEVLKVTAEDEAYPTQAICDNRDSGEVEHPVGNGLAFLVTFSNDASDVPHEDDHGTWFDLEEHAKGNLEYHVFHLTEEENDA